MPVLKQTDHVAQVRWLGQVPAGGGIRAEAVPALDLDFDGIAGDRHSGALRPSCSRVVNLYPKDTPIRNTRQLSILSIEEMEEIARRMETDALDPVHLGASIVLSGIPDFSHVPPGARIQGPDGLTLTVDIENRPCHLPAREIEIDRPGLGARFKSAAEGLRGVTAWVERPGRIALGDRLRLFVPDQRAWAP